MTPDSLFKGQLTSSKFLGFFWWWWGGGEVCGRSVIKLLQVKFKAAWQCTWLLLPVYLVSDRALYRGRYIGPGISLLTPPHKTSRAVGHVPVIYVAGHLMIS